MRASSLWKLLGMSGSIVLGSSAGHTAGLGNVRLGMSKTEALAAMQQSGEVKQAGGDPTMYWGGGYSIGLCDERVESITTDLEPNFGEFTRTVNRAQMRYGAPSSVRTFVGDGSGGRLVFEWALADGTGYSVEYAEIGRSVHPAESIWSIAPCNSDDG